MTVDKKPPNANLENQRRRSIRLRGYDYSQAGGYFVTICTQNQEHLFGAIVGGEMILNDAGNMIQIVWDEIPSHYGGIDIDEFVIMPNHVHGIFIIAGTIGRGIVGATPRGCPDTNAQPPGQARGKGQPQGVAPTVNAVETLTLGDIVHRFKTMTTKRYADGVKQWGWKPFPGRVWQRNYWEHIVRNERELNRIRDYIHNNPAKWESDRLNLSEDRSVYPTTARESTVTYASEGWMV
ncbi:MAG: transposase [Syntrophales bacterium]